MKSRHLVALLLVALAVSACGSAGAPAAARTGYAHAEALVDSAWVAAHMADSQVRLVDVSSKRDVYDKGHLPGAVYVNVSAEMVDPLDTVRGRIMAQPQLEALLGRLGVRPTNTIVLYDDMGSLFATRAFWVLRYYGHDKLSILNGGSPRWTAEGHALSKDVPVFPLTQYTAKPPGPGLRVTADQVRLALEKPGITLLDARSAKEYTGEEVRAARGGHIPGAVNVEWNKALAADGTFRPAEELARLYQRAGIAGDEEIIAYCQSGVRGAHAWFVLEILLGYERTTLYDGSWEEWGNRTDVPVSMTVTAPTTAATPMATPEPDPCD